MRLTTKSLASSCPGYARAAAANVLDKIARPAFILYAKNDPFIRITPESRQKIAANSNITFVETYDPSLPDVLANRDQFIQIFLNLVKNAAEAIGDQPDGQIELTTAFRPGVRLQIPGSKTRVSLPLEFCVRDNGAGVPADLLPHLFDPFVTTKPTGTGLGLALVAKIVGDHGGIIECESQPRHTIFRVLMPMFTGDDAVPGGGT